MAGSDTGLVFSLVLIPHTPKPSLPQPQCSGWSGARNSGNSSFPSWGLESGRGAPCADLSGPSKVSAHVLGKGSHLTWWEEESALDRGETCAATPALLVLGRTLGWSFTLADADASSVRWAGGKKPSRAHLGAGPLQRRCRREGVCRYSFFYLKTLCGEFRYIQEVP